MHLIKSFLDKLNIVTFLKFEIISLKMLCDIIPYFFNFKVKSSVICLCYEENRSSSVD